MQFGRILSRLQRQVITCGAILLAFMCLFPPMLETGTPVSYRFIIDASRNIDVARWVVPMLAVAFMMAFFAALGVFYDLSEVAAPKQKQQAEEPAAKSSTAIH